MTADNANNSEKSALKTACGIADGALESVSRMDLFKDYQSACLQSKPAESSCALPSITIEDPNDGKKHGRDVVEAPADRKNIPCPGGDSVDESKPLLPEKPPEPVHMGDHNRNLEMEERERVHGLIPNRPSVPGQIPGLPQRDSSLRPNAVSGQHPNAEEPNWMKVMKRNSPEGT